MLPAARLDEADPVYRHPLHFDFGGAPRERGVHGVRASGACGVRISEREVGLDRLRVRDRETRVTDGDHGSVRQAYAQAQALDVDHGQELRQCGRGGISFRSVILRKHELAIDAHHTHSAQPALLTAQQREQAPVHLEFLCAETA